MSIVVEEFWKFFSATDMVDKSSYVFKNLKSIICMHSNYEIEIKPDPSALEKVLDNYIINMALNLKIHSADIKNKLIYGIKPGGCNKDIGLNLLDTQTYIKQLQSFTEPIKGFYLWNINRDFGVIYQQRKINIKNRIIKFN